MGNGGMVREVGDRLSRQARWISELQRALLEEKNLLDQIAECLEQHDLNTEERTLLNQWRRMRGFPAR